MRTILLLAMLLPASTVLADTPVTETTSGVSTMSDNDCSRARKLGRTCVLTIEDEDITGEVATNSGEKIVAIDWGKMSSLISVRRDFIPEIVKTAEDL